MKQLFLHEVHEKAGANFIQIKEREIPADYGDVKSELNAINQNIGLLDRSYLGKISVSGSDALDILNRISTNDLQHLSVGTVCDTVFATPKGRLIDYCRVIHSGDDLVLISSFFTVNHLIDWINRFIIFEDAEVKDVSSDYAWFTLLGSHAKQFLGHLTNSTLTDSDDAIWINLEGITFPALRNNYFKIPAYNFCFKNAEAWPVILKLIEHLESSKGLLIGDTTFQIIRVESAIPDWGTEITQDYNPHEARLTSAISFTKGCYTGQEVIARMDTYDKVQQYLMIIELSEQLTNHPPLEVYIDEEQVGHLTSYAFNPITGRSIGLGYIKKMYTTENDIYVEVLANDTKIPARLKIPPQAYL